MKLNKKLLETIEQKQDSDSFYLLDSKQFIKNYDSLLKSFKKFYDNTTIAYSYKTNYIPAFCKIIDEKGGYAEVVSDMEMDLAKKIDVSSDNIYFNGPVKEKDYIEKLMLDGGHINVDSIMELNKILEILLKYQNRIFKIGLRCNFDVKDDVISRFGFDTNGEDFKTAIEIIKSNNNLELSGLHCHFATRSLSSWKNRTEGMLKIIDKYFSNIELKYISLGGGLYGNMSKEMKKQFSIKIPSFVEYAEVSAKSFSDYFLSKNYKPMLIIEPGTALVANAIKYVTKVKSIKQVQGRIIATLSGSSYNINPNANRKNVPIEIYPSSNSNHSHYSNVFFAGYTCIESDYLYKNYNGELGIDDYIVFSEVGSYSVVMKPPFIKPNVPIIEPSIDGLTFTVVKRKEGFNDVFHTYLI